MYGPTLPDGKHCDTLFTRQKYSMLNAAVPYLTSSYRSCQSVVFGQRFSTPLHASGRQFREPSRRV